MPETGSYLIKGIQHQIMIVVHNFTTVDKQLCWTLNMKEILTKILAKNIVVSGYPTDPKFSA